MRLLGLLITSTTLLGVLVSGCKTVPEHLGDSGVITVNDGRGRLSAPLDVYFYRPQTFNQKGPVVIVVPGMKRNAEGYRNYFSAAAKGYGAMILVPKFSRKHFRGSRRFSLGNIKNRVGKTLPRIDWSFSVIDRIFAEARVRLGLVQKKFYLFGHSAGAQFVHRMILFSPSEKMIAAVAANAGWYTEPDFTIGFPYGLKGGPITKENLRQVFGAKLTVLLGQNDDDEMHRSLRKTDEANAQGPHRLDRGRKFYHRSMKIAEELGVPFLWDKKEVPNVGHSGRGMAAPALDVLLNRKKSLSFN